MRSRLVIKLVTLVGVLALVAAACSSDDDKTAAPDGKASTPPKGAPGADSAAAGAPAAGGPLWAKPPIAKTWAEYFGVEVEEASLDGGGEKVLNPKPGDLYFYTNSGTGWGATNTKNSVVVFDATDMTKWKHVATTDLPDEYSVGYSSHGATVSADGRWIYLQSMGNPEKPPRLLVIDGFTLKPVKVLKETLGGFGGHHLNNFTGPDGREYVMNIDFNWNWGGAGAWVIDPSKDHAVVGGMNRQDFSGNPYILSGDIQGKFMFATVPAPSAALRGKMEGYLAKIDMTTWKVVGAVPILDPIWPEITQDGKTAWVTEGDGQKVKKVDLEKMEVVAEVSTGPGPWMTRLSCDESKLYVADKGESAGYGQQGRTMTIIDTKFNIVTNVLPIGLTTDHVLLSPDCRYIIANSNAEHSLWIFDAETEQQVATVEIPNGGDPHGGTFVQWKDDGNGGVVGEVVSQLSGMRGSARENQQKLITEMASALVVQVNPKNNFFKTPAGFTPTVLNVEPGKKVTLLFSYASGTSGSAMSVEGADGRIERFELRPGQRKIVSFEAPAAEGPLTVNLVGAEGARPLTIQVAKGAAPAAASAAAGPHEVKLTADGLKWDTNELDLKAGEKVRFTIVNNDDEKHNFVNGETGLLPPASPDVGGGQTSSFEWTVPKQAGTFKFFCSYHPNMVVNTTIK